MTENCDQDINFEGVQDTRTKSVKVLLQPLVPGEKSLNRRFPLNELTYCHLEKKITDLFPELSSKRFRLYWKDSAGDDIELSSDDELVEALSAVGEDVLKIYVKVVAVKVLLPPSDSDEKQNRIRRCPLNQLTYCHLVKKITDLFPELSPDRLRLYWKDGAGDLIELSLDEELVEAMSAFGEDVLKIYVKEVPANGWLWNGPKNVERWLRLTSDSIDTIKSVANIGSEIKGLLKLLA